METIPNRIWRDGDPTLGPNPTAAWRVTDVQPLPDYRLRVRFRDQTEGVVDLSRLVTGQGAGVFAALRAPAVFAQVRIECGAVTWPGGPDLAPDAMYDAIRQRGEWIPD